MTKADKTFTELKTELDTVLETLQSDGADVDEALKAYERGMELVGLLEAQLKTAENTVTKLKKKFDT